MISTNRELIEYLKNKGVLKSEAIISAWAGADRINFVKKNDYEEAYEDYPLSIGYNATISQPTTVAIMLELLEPKPGEKILDVGSGSGWTTAILANIVGPTGEVIGIELVPDLITQAEQNLKPLRLNNVTFYEAENIFGYARLAPYDRILVSAAAQEIPDSLIQQLKPGGRLVIPIKDSINIVKKSTDGSIDTEELPGFVFVPLQKKA